MSPARPRRPRPRGARGHAGAEDDIDDPRRRRAALHTPRMTRPSSRPRPGPGIIVRGRPRPAHPPGAVTGLPPPSTRQLPPTAHGTPRAPAGEHDRRPTRRPPPGAHHRRRRASGGWHL